MKILKTNFNIEQCKKILKDNRWKFKYIFDSDKNHFIKSYGNFFYSTIIEGRNSYSIFFWGRLIDKIHFTEIRGIFFIHPYTLIFSIFFLSIILIIYWITGFQIEILSMIILFISGATYSLFSSRKYPERIIDLLIKIFNAEVIK